MSEILVTDTTHNTHTRKHKNKEAINNMNANCNDPKLL